MIEHVVSLCLSQTKQIQVLICNSNTALLYASLLFQLKAKRSDCNSKATQARNDYLLTLAAANAHHDRYYHTDLLHCIQVFTERFKNAEEGGARENPQIIFQQCFTS